MPCGVSSSADAAVVDAIVGRAATWLARSYGTRAGRAPRGAPWQWQRRAYRRRGAAPEPEVVVCTLSTCCGAVGLATSYTSTSPTPPSASGIPTARTLLPAKCTTRPKSQPTRVALWSVTVAVKFHPSVELAHSCTAPGQASPLVPTATRPEATPRQATQ
eukprot:scaffold6303_cov75-Phaeocystis_antarctica.AAC.5